MGRGFEPHPPYEPQIFLAFGPAREGRAIISPTPTVVVIATGGTIDKVYTLAGELEVGPPAADTLLDEAGVDADLESVLAKDSLDMTTEDRVALTRRLDRLDAEHVVITHGTDTLTTTAEHLARHAQGLHRKVIVITGAMQPASMHRSDAAFNLGGAVVACQVLPPGVHVCMHGRIFPAGAVVKDRARGRFVPASENTD